MKTTYKPTYEEIVHFLNERAKWLESLPNHPNPNHKPCPRYLSALNSQISEIRFLLKRMDEHKDGVRAMVHEDN